MVIKFNSHNSRGQLLHDLQQIFVDFCISRKTSKLKNIYHIDWINHWKQRAKKLSFELFSQKKKKERKKKITKLFKICLLIVNWYTFQ